MQNQTKNLLGIIVAVLCVGMLIGGSMVYVLWPKLVEIQSAGQIHFSFTSHSLHTLITMYKDGVQVFQEYHAGAVTKLGLNTTFAKLLGNSTYYNMTAYNLNVTYVGIGNKGTLDTDDTILPGEWNRTSAVVHDATYNSCNWTCTIKPGAGPYTADCLGLYYEAAGESLWAYDTFGEVTGIDSSFTIVLEIQVSAS